MLASYAGDDHRLSTESREGLIQAPSLCVRNADRGVHGNIPPTQARKPARDRGALERVP